MSPPLGVGTDTLDSGARPLLPPPLPLPEPLLDEVDDDPLEAKDPSNELFCGSPVLQPTTPRMAIARDPVIRITDGLLRERNVLMCFSFLSVNQAPPRQVG
jgi:hypothetical protein